MLRCLRDLQSFQYLPCRHKDHDSQPLNIVCADQDCENRSLLCIYCEQELHEDHKTIPLKDYLRKVMSQAYIRIVENTSQPPKQVAKQQQQINDPQESNKNLKSILTYCKEADSFRQQFLQEVQAFRAQINQCLDQIITSGAKYTNELNGKMKEISGLMKQVENIIKENKEFVDMNKYTQENLEAYYKKYERRAQNILKYGFVTEDYHIPIHQQLQNIIIDCQTRKNQIKAFLKGSFSNFKNNIYAKILQSLNAEIETYSSIVEFAWSQKLKGQSMKIDKYVVQKCPNNSNQRFALLDKSLQQYVLKRKPVSWTFKITKLVGWIGLGICMKNKIVNSNFQFNYQSLGHGSYLISSNGYSWSSTESAYNSTHHSISFTTNDYVTIQFNPVTWKLKFMIQGKNYGIKKKSMSKMKKPIPSINSLKTFQLDIENLNNSDEYYPCVNLCSNGDSVQIINS